MEIGVLYQSTWKNFVIWKKSELLIRWYKNTRIFFCDPWISVNLHRM